MDTLKNTTENQPLKGIELYNMKVNNFTFSKDDYKFIVGRAKYTDRIYYVTFVNGKLIDVRHKLDQEHKKFYGLV
jgi:hypothetical protein